MLRASITAQRIGDATDRRIVHAHSTDDFGEPIPIRDGPSKWLHSVVHVRSWSRHQRNGSELVRQQTSSHGEP